MTTTPRRGPFYLLVAALLANVAAACLPWDGWWINMIIAIILAIIIVATEGVAVERAGE